MSVNYCDTEMTAEVKLLNRGGTYSKGLQEMDDELKKIEMAQREEGPEVAAILWVTAESVYSSATGTSTQSNTRG